MIDVNLLKQLGWSQELIDETTRTAESLRAGDILDVGGPHAHIFSVGASAVYADASQVNTASTFTVQQTKHE